MESRGRLLVAASSTRAPSCMTGGGYFRLDIHAKDGDDRSVVIENQLERTDHGHLGQCLVYASGLDASTVIWVAPKFREEFRSALDWLNEHTDSELGFFGIEVGIVQIGNGPPAPVFDIVSRPNDGQKTVKTAGNAAEARAATPVNAARQALFTDILTAANTRQPAISVPTPKKRNWIAFASGAFGNWSMSIPTDGRSRVEAYKPVDLDDPADREATRQWGVDTLVAMYNTLNAPYAPQRKPDG